MSKKKRIPATKLLCFIVNSGDEEVMPFPATREGFVQAREELRSNEGSCECSVTLQVIAQSGDELATEILYGCVDGEAIQQFPAKTPDSEKVRKLLKNL